MQAITNTAAEQYLAALLRIGSLFVFLLYAPSIFAADNRQPLELAWFNNIDSQLKALSQQPPECIVASDDPRYSLGRLAFNSPRLLGGQAGRMGLNCASCHPSARTNIDFFITQISDKPGSADISHHFLSSQGGDDVFNPKPIPDLADFEKLRFQDRSSISFDKLLTQLIEVEFDGQTPTHEVFNALRFYLQKNDTRHCESPNSIIRRDFKTDWALIDNGLDSLQESLRVQDIDTIRFISNSMRSTLETFHRFYSIETVRSIDTKLIEVSRSLQTLSMERDDARRRNLVMTLKRSLARLKPELHRHQENSFYNPKIAADYIANTN